MTLDEALADCCVVAILRGIRPDEAVDHVQALFDAGVRVVETPTRPAPSAAPNAPMPVSSTVTERAAPPPARGLSMRGRPAGAMMGDPDERAPAAPAAAPPAPPPAAAVPERRDDAPGGGDDASARFSLLELD